MHFCSNCSNMYYIRLSDDNENELVYYCRNCGNEDTNVSQESVIVSTTNVKKGEQKFHHIINEYTKLDPTLPRTDMIQCPNTSCPTNDIKNVELSGGVKPKNEVIYMRYDDENMKYVYMCVHCDTIWHNNKS